MGNISKIEVLGTEYDISYSYAVKKNEILDMIYPVGSVYVSTNNTDPGSLFGGTWVQIKDRFLLAAGDSYAAGSNGGEATHTLTIAETPKHGHSIYAWTTSEDSAGGTGDAVYVSGKNVYTKSNGATFPGTYKWNTGTFKSYGTFEGIKGFGDPAGNTDFVGDNSAHNNMPPYLAVYIWERIS